MNAPVVQFAPAPPAEDVGTGLPPGPVDDLVFAYPECPEGCGEVEPDYPGWHCSTCLATWPGDGTGGVREPTP